MTLSEYLVHAPKELQEFLNGQWKEAYQEHQITCECGKKRTLLLAYRCLYCGVWYCFNCAQEHFGKTHQEWLIEQRVKSRQQKALALNAEKKGERE